MSAIVFTVSGRVGVWRAAMSVMAAMAMGPDHGEEGAQAEAAKAQRKDSAQAGCQGWVVDVGLGSTSLAAYRSDARLRNARVTPASHFVTGQACSAITRRAAAT